MHCVGTKSPWFECRCRCWYFVVVDDKRASMEDVMIIICNGKRIFGIRMWMLKLLWNDDNDDEPRWRMDDSNSNTVMNEEEDKLWRWRLREMCLFFIAAVLGIAVVAMLDMATWLEFWFFILMSRLFRLDWNWNLDLELDLDLDWDGLWENENRMCRS